MCCSTPKPGSSPADFVAWVKERNILLPDALVDRIIPGFPGAEAENLFAQWSSKIG